MKCFVAALIFIFCGHCMSSEQEENVENIGCYYRLRQTVERNALFLKSLLVSPVLDALAYYDCAKTINALLWIGIDPNQQSYFRKGHSILQVAAFRGNDNTFKVLLADDRINIDLPDIDRQTALQSAVCFKREALVKMLLEKGANPDFQSQLGFTALQIASYCGYTKIVEILLQHKANPNLQGVIDRGSDKKFSPIHTALKEQELEIFKQLLFCDTLDKEIRDEDNTGYSLAEIFDALKYIDSPILDQKTRQKFELIRNKYPKLFAAPNKQDFIDIYNDFSRSDNIKG